MKNMIYTSIRGKQIVFDDFEDNREEYGSFWAEMCPSCHNKYKSILFNKNVTCDGGVAGGTCGVKGCANEADYYVDFAKDCIEIVETEDSDDGGLTEVEITVEHTFRYSDTFKVTKNQLEMLKNGDNPFMDQMIKDAMAYGDAESDYAVNDSEGRTIVDWS